MCVREWCELIHLQEVKDTLPVEVGDNADVIPKVKAVTEMDTPIAILPVIRCKGRQDTEFYPRCIAVLLDGSNDFDGTFGLLFTVPGFHNFAECALTEQFDDFI
jgi:hypothetical protein